MITKFILKTRIIVALVILLFLMNACQTSRRLKYFQDLPDTLSTMVQIGSSKFTEPIIHPDDILSINVNTTDPTAGQPINARNGVNLSVGINNQTGASGTGTGYLIDKDGYTEIPILGKVHLAGLTTTQAKEAVRTVAKVYFKDPIVDVRFSNFKVTVLGEVNRPASYIMPNEQVTLLDAIGYAGDMTIYGKRENILLLRRSTEGKNYTVRLNMKSKNVVNSPYFFLHQNDVIYVEPRRTRQDNNNENNVVKYLTLAATLITAIVLIHHYKF